MTGELSLFGDLLEDIELGTVGEAKFTPILALFNGHGNWIHSILVQSMSGDDFGLLRKQILSLVLHLIRFYLNL